MSDPLPFKGKVLPRLLRAVKKIKKAFGNNRILLSAFVFVIFVSLVRIWDAQPVFYAHAYTGSSDILGGLESPMFEEEKEYQLFIDGSSKDGSGQDQLFEKNSKDNAGAPSRDLKKRLYEIVGDSPIKEMVPYISRRDERVAAFLIGIAKKESSFGSRSPLKDGETCYNYWGYKGSAGRGTGMGYACFSSAEEAVETVGDRIEVLVNKNRTTPTKMVDTWKCGTSCAGDPGAPGWVSTVAFYFEKIVGRNG